MDNESIDMEGITPAGSLAEVGKKFGTLLIHNVSVASKDDMIVISTISEGTEGPKTGKASPYDKDGSASIDFALTPEVAQKIYRRLGDELKKYGMKS